MIPELPAELWALAALNLIGLAIWFAAEFGSGRDVRAPIASESSHLEALIQEIERMEAHNA